MKSIRKIFFTGMAVILGTSLFLSCSKEENAHADNAKGAITVSIDGELGALAQIDDTKSSLSNPIRLSWEGAEKVYAFDGVKCLGALDVTLKEGKDYYALLSGELSAPSEGTTKVTLVHAPGFTAEKGADMTEGKLSFDLTSQSGAVATTPFVAYATMDYNGQTSIDNLVVNFTFATSIIRINCSGMEASKSFTTTVSGMSNECVLQINGNGASVGTGTTGNISLASANTNAQGTKMLYAGLAKTASKTDVSVVTTQGNKSYEGAIVNGSAWAAKTAYNAICPMSEIIQPYVVIPAKYDGTNVTDLKWYRQNLAISDSGNKTWKPSGSAVKVPGTDEDVINGDYFQWAAHENYALPVNDFGNGQTDRGLLIYESFTSTACGDASDAFEFKSPEAGKKYRFSTSDSNDYIGISPYYNKTDKKYTVYNPNIDSKVTLESTDDVANVILGGGWRMPTSAEFQAMYDATTWTWDSADKGYYVTEKGVELASDKSNALLFFPAAGHGWNSSLNIAGSEGTYWSSSLLSNYSTGAYDLVFDSGYVDPQDRLERHFGLTVRPVSD